MKTRDYIIVIIALLAMTVLSMIGWYSFYQKNKALEAEVSTLKEKEQRSTVMRSVSRQMEEIAYQQKIISDEQREEALQQTRVANEMRERSERERQNALEAERQALLSEQHAREASEIAEAERLQAEQQRNEAEYSKRVTDTLSYIALARTLGSIAIAQQQSGNHELAEPLSYAAFTLTQRYKGDVYYPSVFQSLLEISGSRHTWAVNTGAITAVTTIPKTEMLASVSDYGEIMIHEKRNEKLRSKMLFNNSLYDFRALFVGNAGAIFAASRTGHLVALKDGKPIITILGFTPIGMTNMDDDHLLVVGERTLCLYNMNKDVVTDTRSLDFKTMVVSRYDYKPALFDDVGRMHVVRAFNKLETEQMPFREQVTAFGSSKGSGQRVYGTSEGIIYVLDRDGTLHRLVGHRSRISRVRMVKTILYSTSYDGTIKLWATSNEKIEPMTLYEGNKWILDFSFDAKKNYVWTGDVHGNLAQVGVATKMMSQQLREQLKRDLTEEEWTYYIGRNIPYEKFKK